MSCHNKNKQQQRRRRRNQAAVTPCQPRAYSRRTTRQHMPAHRASVGNMTIHWAAGFGTAHRMLCSPRPISFPFPRTWGVKVEGIETSFFLSLFRVSVLVRPWSARVAYQFKYVNPRMVTNTLWLWGVPKWEIFCLPPPFHMGICRS